MNEKDKVQYKTRVWKNHKLFLKVLLASIVEFENQITVQNCSKYTFHGTDDSGCAIAQFCFTQPKILALFELC